MQQATDAVHSLLDSLSGSTGIVSPSIYDTAQVLRFQPGLDDREHVVDWLLRQQRADGGWGDPALPLARAIPTLACVLALRDEGTPAATRALRGGGRFLRALAASLPREVPNDLPVGMELLLPALLRDMRRAGNLALDPTPFAPIIALGQQRQASLAGRQLPPGSTALHSFESLDLPAEAGLVDGAGSLSHSPAATASWLRRAGAGQGTARDRARNYLARSQAGTPVPAPGIYPGVWPLNRFEQSFVLYFLAIAGAFEDTAYKARLQACARELLAAIGATGVGLSDHFTVDGDDTAAAIIALDCAGLPVRRAWLDHFREGARYYAYRGERHGSLSLIARAMHAAALLGEDVSATADYVRGQQRADGRWSHDKWHASWLYPTMHAIIAMALVGDVAPVMRAGAAILDAQDSAGGWGTAEETAYALLGLVHVYRVAPSDELFYTLRAGRAHLLASRPGEASGPTLWIGKELYTPTRIVQAAQLAALLAVDALVREVELEVPSRRSLLLQVE